MVLEKFALDSASISDSLVESCRFALEVEGSNPEKECLRTFIYPSIYAIHLRRWLNYFPLTSFLVIDGNRFTANPFPELKKIEKFLELEPMITEGQIFRNKTSGFFCLRKKGGPKCILQKGIKHFDLPDDSMRCLSAFFKPFNEELSLLAKQNFSW